MFSYLYLTPIANICTLFGECFCLKFTILYISIAGQGGNCKMLNCACIYEQFGWAHLLGAHQLFPTLGPK